MPKTLVVSAVNFTEGGGLTVLRECLASAVKLKPIGWHIVALVHDKSLINQPDVELIELPISKRSWLSHLYHEWIVFWKISKKLNPDLWLSLHDITPIVKARRRVVYCHNPAPFYAMSWREIYLSPKFWIFTLVYKYVYRLFIKQNYYVVVQQSWLRDAFVKMFGYLPIVVAHPLLNITVKNEVIHDQPDSTVFLYPVIPRIFKNFEVICNAASILVERGVEKFEVRLTLDGNENRYSKWVYAEYNNIAGLKFIGSQSRGQIDRNYQEATAVVFPSKLETWGLPISEAKRYNKPLLLANLPYAHETVGNYDKVSFFPANDASALADLMQEIIEGVWKPAGANQDVPMFPFARNWDDLWSILIKDL